MFERISRHNNPQSGKQSVIADVLLLSGIVGVFVFISISHPMMTPGLAGLTALLVTVTVIDHRQQRQTHRGRGDNPPPANTDKADDA